MARPFVTFGGARELPMIARAGLRPLGTVLGASVGRLSSVRVASGFDGDEIPAVTDAFGRTVARGRARLIAEAAAHGAAFVADTEIAFPLEFARAAGATNARFHATGTAYAHDGQGGIGVAPTNLSGLDLARALLAGYRPTGLAIGYSFWTQHSSYRSTGVENALARSVFGFNVEHPDFTLAVRAAWTLARSRLERDVRLSGGEGAIGLRVHLQEVRAGIVAVVLSATAVRREGYAPRAADPLLGIRLAR